MEPWLSAEREARPSRSTRWRIHWNSENKFNNRLRIRRNERARKNSRYASHSGVWGSSLNLVFQNRSVNVIVLRRSDKISIQFRHKKSRFRGCPYRGCSQRPIMVRISFFINVNCACVRFRINAFGREVKNHAVNAFADRDAGYLLPGRRIENHYNFAATTHEKAMS